MAERFFLYIDILGFKGLVKSGFDISEIYRRIDQLNVHSDKGFTCIVFSDTILVYGADGWLRYPNQAVMWLIEFAQDLFYRLISIDVHIRAYITKGNFEHHKLKNLEAYYGTALIDCYEREKQIKCTGVFLDSRLESLCDRFFLTKYDKQSHFVHVMQCLDQVSFEYAEYPMSGQNLDDSGMQWWVAYLLHYLHNIYNHMHNVALPDEVRRKYSNAWCMISKRHKGLLKSLANNNFIFGNVINLDWSTPMSRIGTKDGAWG